MSWGTASGAIDKSKHDIIYYFGHGANAQGGGAEACTYCHHPEHYELSEEQQWDSSTWGDATRQGYQVYTSQDGDAMLICLSCHDGIASPDIFSENSIDGNHPVGFDYVQLSYQEKRFPYYDYRVGGVKGAASGQVYPLIDFKMECITCHDPHMGESHFVRGGKEFLRGSTLCVDCHSCVSGPCNNSVTGLLK